MTKYIPYGYQSQQSLNINDEDDIYSSSMYYNSQNSLLYVVGGTYSHYFDDNNAASNGGVEQNEVEGEKGGTNNHLENSSCFLSIYKLPTEHNGSLVTVNSVDELLHMDESSNHNNNNNVGRESINKPKLIYSKILGTYKNTEVCSNIIQLPRVHDALLSSNGGRDDDIKIKLALIGHVQPTPITSEELAVLAELNQEKLDNDSDSTGGLVEFNIGKKPDNNRSLLRFSTFDIEQDEATPKSQQQVEHKEGKRRELENIEISNINHGGFLHSISTMQQQQPISTKGKVYGFVADYDLSISTSTEVVSVTAKEEGDKQGGVYGALLGGTTLDSSPIIYPTSITQNERIPNELYVVSMHSDDTTNEEGGEEEGEEMLNPEYKAEIAFEVVNGELKERADVTLGGAGLGQGSELVGGGVPKYGTNFYVNVQQVSITPYEELMNIEPTQDEHIKQTMKLGWSFGFKLNDAEDVRPSFIKYIKGRTVDEDLLLLGGTTRKLNDSLGDVEYDGFITKLTPPPPTPVEDVTSGSTVEEAMLHQTEDQHPTKRIDSTTGRDETVTGICLPPPDPISGLVKHAYIVGSTSSNDEASLAYLLKIQLHDLSTVWKQRIPSIHPAGLKGGDVLGEGCSVSPNGKFVYLSGTIDGGSALDTRILPNSSDKEKKKIVPVGGKSDVFVVSFDTDFGSVQWAKQLGTVYEDKLARGGGIECDNEGNVIIMGNTRGGLQRYRPERSDPNVRLASDIFIMSLSREDGEYVHAPFVGGGASSGGGLDSASLETSAAAEANDTAGGGLSTGAKGGIAAIFIFWGVLAFFIIGRRRSRRRYNEQNSKNWEKRGGDDFIYDNNRPLGGRRDSSSLREPWDDGIGSSGRNRVFSWMSSIRSPGSGESSDSSIASMGSTNSASSKKMEENSDFLASLRQEANETMKKMISRKDTPPDSTDMFDTHDPRLDGGASIRDLLATYRDVKKKSLVDDEKDGSLSVTTSKRNPPPPPPPRRRSSHDADGLADFSII